MSFFISWITFVQSNSTHCSNFSQVNNFQFIGPNHSKILLTNLNFLGFLPLYTNNAVRKSLQQGCQKFKPPKRVVLIFVQPPGLNRDAPERSAWRIREYTITKSIKTGSVMTSFYRFLLLRIEEVSEKSEWGCQSQGQDFYRFSLLV